MKLRHFAALIFVAVVSIGTTFAQDWAKERLNKSPRHSEWVDLKHGDRTVRTFVVYPEVKTKVPVVLVIHEIFGLTDWAKNLADELAAAGCIAIAPDLLSAPGKDTSSYPDQGAANKAISALPAAQVFADLDAAAEYAAKLPAGNGSLAVTGFCWAAERPLVMPTTIRNSRRPTSSMARGPKTRRMRRALPALSMGSTAKMMRG